MKANLIKETFDRLPNSIKLTAAGYVEGRNILIKCLSRGSNSSIEDVVMWLLNNHIQVKELNYYLTDNGYNRDKQ